MSVININALGIVKKMHVVLLLLLLGYWKWQGIGLSGVDYEISARDLFISQYCMA
jgi:hypothetical protein